MFRDGRRQPSEELAGRRVREAWGRLRLPHPAEVHHRQHHLRDRRVHDVEGGGRQRQAGRLCQVLVLLPGGHRRRGCVRGPRQAGPGSEGSSGDRLRGRGSGERPVEQRPGARGAAAAAGAAAVGVGAVAGAGRAGCRRRPQELAASVDVCGGDAGVGWVEPDGAQDDAQLHAGGPRRHGRRGRVSARACRGVPAGAFVQRKRWRKLHGWQRGGRWPRHHGIASCGEAGRRRGAETETEPGDFGCNFEGGGRQHGRQFHATACPGRRRHHPLLLNRPRSAALAAPPTPSSVRYLVSDPPLLCFGTSGGREERATGVVFFHL
eukprot:Rhum_TRINITY_DN15185_c10_g2::Rhum_TRINITY_DN15185_c10_g2_i3::g.142947::m.142947